MNKQINKSSPLRGVLIFLGISLTIAGALLSVVSLFIR